MTDYTSYIKETSTGYACAICKRTFGSIQSIGPHLPECVQASKIEVRKRGLIWFSKTIDESGIFSLTKLHNGSYVAKLCINSFDYTSLQKCLKVVGAGKINKISGDALRERYQWTLSPPTLGPILRAIYPLLTRKKDQARILIAFLDDRTGEKTGISPARLKVKLTELKQFSVRKDDG